jgi:uncharacterized 2Fe-2S/4Fe-4S cluster protein (DUF4445 family)
VPDPLRALLVSGEENGGGAPRVPEAGKPCAGETLLIRCDAGWTAAEAVFLSGLIPAPALCAGHALCGRCRLRILAAPGDGIPVPLPAELRRLSAEELAQGFRLACRHGAEVGMLLEIPVPERPRRTVPAPAFRRDADAPHSPFPCSRNAGNGACCALALDLGTTTLHWRLLSPDRAIPDGNADYEKKAGTHPGVARNGPEETPDAGNSSVRDAAEPTEFPETPDAGCSPLPRPPSAGSSPSRLRSGARDVLWEDMRANPQAGAGSDVISRLAFARKPGGGEMLRALILHALRDIVREARSRAVAGGYAGVDRICAAGNPIMIALLLGRTIAGTAHAPEFPAFRGEESIPGLPSLITAPQPSSFVGGDITAGYAALALDPEKKAPGFPFLLADMGTNGEFLLALSPDAALTSSVALGPALEGAGLYSGVAACPGAAADFLLEADGLKALALPEDFNRPDAILRRVGRDEKLPGMTGAACLALLHIMRRCGVMSGEGFFTVKNAGALGRFFILRRDAGGECFLAPGHGLRLYASDVESVLKVKAAFSLGIRRLLDEAGLAFSGLSALYLAGSLGGHVRKDALEGLGFIAPGAGERLRIPGNTSLAGAELLLRRPETLEELRRRAQGMRNIDLAADPDFARDFAAFMHF